MPGGTRPITEVEVEIAGVRTFLRRRGGAGLPVVYVHGNPTHSADWLPFLSRTAGPAIAPDLPCFGRSGRPARERFDASLEAYADWIEELLRAEAPDGFSLVVHDWGAIALAAAARMPERVERLVAINSVPLSGAYRWHWVARLWRRRGVGELVMATMTRFSMSVVLRLSRGDRSPMPDGFIEMIWGCFDAATRRAVLRLYRSADPDRLESAGAGLDAIEAPALVVWGARDPFIGPSCGRELAGRLPGGELAELADAGHWPWLDRPELIERIAAFLGVSR